MELLSGIYKISLDLFYKTALGKPVYQFIKSLKKIIKLAIIDYLQKRYVQKWNFVRTVWENILSRTAKFPCHYILKFKYVSLKMVFQRF